MEMEFENNDVSPGEKASVTEKLIANAKAAEINSESIPVMPKVKEKGKRGPKPGSKRNLKSSEKITQDDNKSAESEPIRPKFDIPTKALCYPFIKVLSSAGVSYTNEPRAAIGAEEAEGMASALGMVLDKYLPDAMAKWGPELVLGASLGQYGLRIYAIKKLQIDKMRMQQAASQPTNGARPQDKNDTDQMSVISQETEVP